MKAVIATDSISLRSRKMLFTFECPPDILINRSRPVHEATGGHAVRGNYCIHNHMGGVILRIIIKNFKQLLEMPFTEAVAQKGSFFHSIGGSKRLV